MHVVWRSSASIAMSCCWLFFVAPPIHAAGPVPDAAPDLNAVAALAEAYPGFVGLDEQQQLRWRDDGPVPMGVVRRFNKVPATIKDASLSEQFYYNYPLDPWHPDQLPDKDPGRIRNQPFFVKMYGDCRKGDVQRRLRTVVWLPKTSPQRLQVTAVNGIDKAVEQLSAEIDALPPAIMAAASKLSGGFACRTISGTRSLSMHAYGAAIDLNASIGHYWKWSGLSAEARRAHRVPREIVELFQKHGFIWGGKWYHVDSLHFEYRPELIAYAKRLGITREQYLQENPP